MKKKKREGRQTNSFTLSGRSNSHRNIFGKIAERPQKVWKFRIPHPPLSTCSLLALYIYIFIDLQLESTQKHEDSSLKKNQLNLNNIQTYEHPPHFHPSGAGRPCRSISQLHSVRLPNEQACVTAWTTPADVTA